MHYPDLPETAEVVWLETPDGLSLRAARFPARGGEAARLVIVNGHREYMEKYAEFIREWQALGVTVYSLDHRGQGLSSRLLADREKSYIRNFDDYIRDLHQVLEHFGLPAGGGGPEKIPGPRYILGHSMGGHIALRYLHDHPGVFDKAVLLSPMLQINLGSPLLAGLSRGLIGLAMRVGLDRLYAPGQGPKNEKIMKLLVRTLLTHDAARYEEERAILDRCPDLYSGGATFGWLDAALASLARIRARGFAARVETPLLALLAEQDRLVVNRAAVKLLFRLPHAQTEIIRGAYHEIYRETDEVRAELWRRMRRFLDL